MKIVKGIHAIVIGVIAIFGAGLVIGGAMAIDLPSMWESSTISDAHGGMMGGDDYMMGAEDDCHDDEDLHTNMHDHMHSHSEEECYDDETGQFHIDGDDYHDDEDWYSHMHDQMHSHSEEECHEDIIEQP